MFQEVQQADVPQGTAGYTVVIVFANRLTFAQITARPSIQQTNASDRGVTGLAKEGKEGMD